MDQLPCDEGYSSLLCLMFCLLVFEVSEEKMKLRNKKEKDKGINKSCLIFLLFVVGRSKGKKKNKKKERKRGKGWKNTESKKEE